jgi:uncharacterized protein YcbX
MVRVAALFVYPIKGCRGIRVDEAAVVARGFDGDRRWMVVDHAGEFVTQRTEPRLALVKTALRPGSIAVSSAGCAPLELPAADPAGDLLDVTVWGHRGPAVRDAAGSAWFSRFLGAPHALVYMGDQHRRPVNPERAAPQAAIVSFADGYPFLLTSEASLAALNQRLAQPITMERFRPNIVVSGCDAFAEDGWARLTVGAIAFRGVKRCDRCSVTTVDPETGERGKEPLRTLATFRQEDGKVWFGMNLIHDGAGALRVGDELAARTGGAP